MIESAAAVTLVGFAALTGIAFWTRKDFSFLGGFLRWGMILALGAIVGAVFFKFDLGMWFSVAMVGIAGAAILYDTSKVLHHFPEDRYVGAALELPDGTMVTGKNSPLMHAASSLVLNAIKVLADIPDKIHLLSPNIIDSIGGLKKDVFGRDSVSLSLDETLIALSISATSNPSAQMAMGKLADLKRCEGHITHIPTPGDEAGLRRLGINMTSEPHFSSSNLYSS